MEYNVLQLGLAFNLKNNNMKKKDLCNCGKPHCYICGSFKN